MTTHILREDKGICGEPAKGFWSANHTFTKDKDKATCNNCLDEQEREDEK